MRRRTDLEHIPALDGLRGLAVAAVLCFHAGLLTGGYLGVDLFFVLSGFLITSLLLREWDLTGMINLAEFWRRRARRLLPALFLLLIGIAAFAAVVAGPYELPRIRVATLTTLFYVANWGQILAGNGYWDRFDRSPLEHTWSLAIEEQFYLLWPLLLFGVLKLTRGCKTALLAIAVAFAAASASVMAMLFKPDAGPASWSRLYLGTDTRAAAVLLGSAFAILLSLRGPLRTVRSRRVLEGLAVVAACGLGWAWATVPYTAALLYQYGFFACGIAAILVIAAAAHPQRSLVARVLEFQPIRGLGLISYGLYLWHVPVYLALQKQWGLQRWTLLAVGAPLSIAVAFGSYRLVEQPIRRRGLRALRRPALAPVGAATAVLLVLVATAGGQERPRLATDLASTSDRGPALGASDELRELPDFSDEQSPVSVVDRRATGGEPGSGPVARPVGRSPRLMIVGDSVAWDLGLKMEERHSELGIIVGNQAMFACPLGRESNRYDPANGGQDRALCRSIPQLWVEGVNRFRPDVVVVHFGGAPIDERELDGTPAPICSDRFREWYRGEVAWAIETLSSTGATVFIAPAAYPTSPLLDQQEMRRNTDCMTEAYLDVVADHPAARLLRLDEWVCPPPERRCQTRINGVNLRPDGIHYDGKGAELVNEWIIANVFTAA
ncbi:MAG: acyltransferase [Acidimicrobiales bacterium]|nr:acyltransferase [Acidimicrobiales bacterium]